MTCAPRNRMRPASFLLTLFLLCLSPSSLFARQEPAANTPHLAYHLSFARSGRLHIRLQADNLPNGELTFAIPAWTPGYYQILHFEKNIENVHAEDAEGHTLPLTHTDAREWKLAATESRANSLVLTYDVLADDSGYGFFGSTLKTSASTKYGYVNGASALLYLAGHTDAPETLTISLPHAWKLASPLASDSVPPAKDGKTETTLHAKDYDELIDSPLQFGEFDETKFDVEGIPFRAVFVGSHLADKPKVAAQLTRIAAETVHLFGSAPFKNYVFFYHIGLGGFQGGLEHRNSTVIHLNEPIRSGDSDSFAAVSAHELFHAWNVKRLRPAGLGPFDFTRPVRTPSLWWAEGVTDYYAYVLLVRCGLRNANWLLDEITERIKELDNTPSRTSVSLEEASRKAWEGFSEGFDGLNYYTKGSLIGLAFDLRLRALSDGQKSLDDVMRALYDRYGKPDVPYPDNAILDALDEVAGASLSDEYARTVRGTDEVDWEDLARAVGLEIRRQPTGYLGVSLDTELPAGNANRPAVVRDVMVNSAAIQLGLQPGDRIVRVNGISVSLMTFPVVVRGLAPQSALRVDILRNGAPRTLTGSLGVRYSDPEIRILTNSTAAHRLDTWLRPTPTPIKEGKA